MSRKIPNERIIVTSDDPNYDYEEVRTCWDTPSFLPRYEDNEDDEDISDCGVLNDKSKNEMSQMQCDISNWHRQYMAVEDCNIWKLEAYFRAMHIRFE